MSPLPNTSPPHAWLTYNPIRTWLRSESRKFAGSGFREFPVDWMTEARMPYQGPEACYQQSLDWNPHHLSLWEALYLYYSGLIF